MKRHYAALLLLLAVLRNARGREDIVEGPNAAQGGPVDTAATPLGTAAATRTSEDAVALDAAVVDSLLGPRAVSLCPAQAGYRAAANKMHIGDVTDTFATIQEAVSRCTSLAGCKGFSKVAGSIGGIATYFYQLHTIIAPAQIITNNCLYTKITVELGPVSTPPWRLGSFVDARAKWIWTRERANQTAPGNVISVFTHSYAGIPKAVAANLTMRVVVDGSCDVLVDNVFVGSTGGKTVPPQVPAVIPFAAGSSLQIMLRCSNEMGTSPAGVLAALVGASNGVSYGYTDGTWVGNTVAAIGYKPEDIPAFAAVHELGPPVMGPWRVPQNWADGSGAWTWSQPYASGAGASNQQVTFYLSTWSELWLKVDDTCDIFYAEDYLDRTSASYLGTVQQGPTSAPDSVWHLTLPHDPMILGTHLVILRCANKFFSPDMSAGLLAAVRTNRALGAGHFLVEFTHGNASTMRYTIAGKNVAFFNGDYYVYPWNVPTWPDPSARWMWSSRGSYNNAPNTVLSTFTRWFRVPLDAGSLYLDVVADDKCDVFANTRYLGTARRGWPPQTPVNRIWIGPEVYMYDSGRLNITLRCANRFVLSDEGKNPAGVLASLYISDNEDGTLLGSTDGTSWTFSTSATTVFDPSYTGTTQSAELGQYNMAPYSRYVSFGDWDTNAMWIWSAQGSQNNAPMDVLTTFYQMYKASYSTTGTLYISADTYCDVFLAYDNFPNFAYVGTAELAPISMIPLKLRAGPNLILLRCSNSYSDWDPPGRNPAGVCAALKVAGEWVSHTDQNWQYTTMSV